VAQQWCLEGSSQAAAQLQVLCPVLQRSGLAWLLLLTEEGIGLRLLWAWGAPQHELLKLAASSSACCWLGSSHRQLLVVMSLVGAGV
jgi:hypothetical protein